MVCPVQYVFSSEARSSICGQSSEGAAMQRKDKQAAPEGTACLLWLLFFQYRYILSAAWSCVAMFSTAGP